MSFIPTIQFIETFRTESEASAALHGCRDQAGLIGLRLLPHSPVKPGWQIQMFFSDVPEATCEALATIGARRGLVPVSLCAIALGFNEAALG